MKIILVQIIEWGSENPKRLFMLDGMGAILSAFLLGIVFVELESVFGIPRPTLYFLALLSLFIFSCDIYYSKVKIVNDSPFLRAIALMNLTYSFISIGMVIYYFNKVTYLGVAYILIEVLIIISLAIIELKVARNLNSN